MSDIEKHDLHHEFPESAEAIHHLKTNDHHFAKLFDEYHAVEHDIHRIESGAEASSDEYLENKKKERLMLKDQLYHMIQGYEKSAS